MKKVLGLSLLVFGANAFAKMPISPEFTITKLDPDASADRFIYKCASGLNVAQGPMFVTRLITPEMIWKPEPGVFADGDWTCYADAQKGTGATATYTPTNSVSFTIDTTPDPIPEPIPFPPFKLEVI